MSHKCPFCKNIVSLVKDMRGGIRLQCLKVECLWSSTPIVTDQELEKLCWEAFIKASKEDKEKERAVE